MSGICSAHQHHEAGCELCEAWGKAGEAAAGSRHLPWHDAYQEGLALAAKFFPSTTPKEREHFAQGYARQKTKG